MFTLKKTKIPGCFEIQPKIIDDARGRFVKIFHKDGFAKLNLESTFAEEYYSHSRQGVIRGMHFQIPPSDHVKVVYCIHGEVQDVVLDLRRGSPTYGEAIEIRLSESEGNGIYIPKGMAHGFCATSPIATLIYKVTSIYDSNKDRGVLWNSFGFEWQTKYPVISKRDSEFTTLEDFQSPFEYML